MTGTILCPSCESQIRLPNPTADGKRRCPWCNTEVGPDATPAKEKKSPKHPPLRVNSHGGEHDEWSDDPVLLEEEVGPRSAAFTAVAAPQLPLMELAPSPSRGRGLEITLALTILLLSSVLAAGGFFAAREWASIGTSGKEEDVVADREVPVEQAPAVVRGPELAPAPRLAPSPAKKVADFRLPGPLQTAVAGGDGRFVVFHTPTVSKLVIYEPATDSVIKYIDGVDVNAVIAAGREKLVLGREDDGRLIRIDLPTGRQEAIASRQGSEQLKYLAWGAAADGPLVHVTRIDAAGGRIKLIDPATFKELKPTINDPQRQFPPLFPLRYSGTGAPRLVASADGRAFGFAGMLMIRDGEGFRIVRLTSSKTLRPSNDGKACFGSGIFDDNGTRVAAPQADATETCMYLPAVTGPFFVSVIAHRNPDRTIAEVKLALHANLDPTPLGPLPGGAELTEWANREPTTWVRTLDRHLFVIPGTGHVVVAVPGSEVASVYKVDVGDLLARSRRSVQFLSQPVAEVSRGRAFTYSAVAWAAKGPAVFDLEFGPPGMTVSPAGLVSWDVPTNSSDPSADVRLAARSADGNTTTQVFRLNINNPSPISTPPKIARRPVRFNDNANANAEPQPGERITPVNHKPGNGPVIFCGGGDGEFQEKAPPGGLLIGFEVALSPFDGIDVVRGFRPIYRVGEKEEFGQKHGERRPYTITVKAKPGYAVGGVTYRGLRWFNTCSLIFMKVNGDRLDVNDQYSSEWLGKKRSDPIFQFVTDGTPITGFAGRRNLAEDVTHGFGFIFKEAGGKPK